MGYIQEVVHKLPEKYLPETTPFYFNVLARGLNFAAMVTVSKLDEAYASGRTIVLKLVMSADGVTLTHLLRLCSVGENLPDTIGNVYVFESSSYNCKLTPQEDGSYAVELNGGGSV